MQTQELIRRRDAAFAKRKAGDYSAALAEFQDLEALSDHPTDIATLRFFQTTILTDMGRIDDALDRISKVDKTVLGRIDQIDYEFESARLLRAEGRIAEALERTEKALKATTEIDKEYDVRGLATNLRTLKGVLLSESGRCDDAIPILENVPVEDEGWAQAKIRLGDCNLKRERYLEAINSYASVASSTKRVDPIHRKTALRNIGCAYFYSRDYAKAVEYLTKVEGGYDARPDLKGELFDMLASAYSHLGKNQDAQKYRVRSTETRFIQ